MTTLLAIMKSMSTPKSTAVHDIDIDIADITGQKYRYRIDIGKVDITYQITYQTRPPQGKLAQPQESCTQTEIVYKVTHLYNVFPIAA